MESQKRVAEFLDRHQLETRPEFRLLDLVSEVGEVAKEANESTDYGAVPDTLEVDPLEIGDVLFALLALSHSLEVDAEDALEQALDKYERRLAEGESPAST